MLKIKLARLAFSLAALRRPLDGERKSHASARPPNAMWKFYRRRNARPAHAPQAVAAVLVQSRKKRARPPRSARSPLTVRVLVRQQAKRLCGDFPPLKTNL
jgi:hypothetical protein